MKSMNRKGIGLLGIVIALGIVAVLAGGGWYLSSISRQQSTIDTGNSALDQAEALKETLNTQANEQQRQIDALNEQGLLPGSLTSTDTPTSGDAAGSSQASPIMLNVTSSWYRIIGNGDTAAYELLICDNNNRCTGIMDDRYRNEIPNGTFGLFGGVGYQLILPANKYDLMLTGKSSGQFTLEVGLGLNKGEGPAFLYAGDIDPTSKATLSFPFPMTMAPVMVVTSSSSRQTVVHIEPVLSNPVSE